MPNIPLDAWHPLKIISGNSWIHARKKSMVLRSPPVKKMFSWSRRCVEYSDRSPNFSTTYRHSTRPHTSRVNSCTRLANLDNLVSVYWNMTSRNRPGGKIYLTTRDLTSPSKTWGVGVLIRCPWCRGLGGVATVLCMLSCQGTTEFLEKRPV